MSPTIIKSPESKVVPSKQPQSIALFADNHPHSVQVKWLDSGKPILEGQGIQGVETSLSHDDQFCLCVVGQELQGCDIAPVTHRTRERWLSLLTPAWEDLFNELILPYGDSVDLCGTRVWAAMEALIKATGPDPRRSLAIERQIGDTVLFRGVSAGHQLYILTFPIQLSKGPQRIVAIVVTQ